MNSPDYNHNAPGFFELRVIPPRGDEPGGEGDNGVMKFLFTTLLLLLFLLLAGAVGAVMLMLEDSPTITGDGLLAADLREARVFMENADPRRLAAGELSEFTINEQDMELLLNYLLDSLQDRRSAIHGGRSAVYLNEGSAELLLSARLPDNPFGSYLNLSVALSKAGEVLILDGLQIGGLPVPGWIANPLIQRVHTELLERSPEYAAAISAIDSFTLDENRLNIVYQWQPELFEQLSSRGRELLLTETDRERLVAHSQHLTELLADSALSARVALVDVLGPMFVFARDRQGDPVEENRATLLVLSLYASETNTAQLLGIATDKPEPAYRQLLLTNRRDFARHFLISAGLAVSAGTGVAQSLGLLKEVDDAEEGGSGFSFTDIGADRTGIRFAELAVASPDQARALQTRLAEPFTETLFMADFRDLPEFLSAEAFREAYGGVGEPAYEAVLQDIEARIAGMPLFLP